MSKFKDLTGQKIGRLQVIKRANDHIQSNGRHRTMWVCKCDCGNTVIVEAYNLGHTTISCGCHRNNKIVEFNYKHGKVDTRLYRIWGKMKNRCYCKKIKAYKNYGGRGIIVCDEWKNDFKAFYDWAMNNGYADDLTLDRIDTNKNYEPSNCRWADWETQQNNRRNNRRFEIDGKSYTITQLARLYNISRGTLAGRIQKGWDIKTAVEKPIGKNGRKTRTPDQIAEMKSLWSSQV